MDIKDQIFWGIDEQRRLNLKEEIPNVWDKIKSNEITNIEAWVKSKIKKLSFQKVIQDSIKG